MQAKLAHSLPDVYNITTTTKIADEKDKCSPIIIQNRQTLTMSNYDMTSFT